MFLAVEMMAASALTACGKRGDPLAPLRRTPQPLTEFRVAQHGDKLVISYTVPRLASKGERLPVMDVELVRADRPGALEKVGRRIKKRVAPGELIAEEEALPPVGTLLRVAARVLADGRPSPLSPVVTLTVRAVPDAPTGVAGRSSLLGVVVEWTGIVPPQPSPSPASSPGAKGASPSPNPSPSGSPSPPPPGPPEAAATPSPPPEPAPAPPASPTPIAEASLVSPPPSPPGAAAPTSPGAPVPIPKATPKPAPTTGFWLYRRSPDGVYGRPLSPHPVETQAFEDTTAKAGEKWCYVVRTVLSTDPPVESGDSEETCLEVKDLSPPATPAGLTAIVRDNTVELSWNPSPEPDVVAYRIHRVQAPGRLRCTADNVLAEVPAPETSYRDTALEPGLAYLYGVAARDQGGNESACSAEAEGGIQ